MRRLLYPLTEWDLVRIERDYAMGGDYDPPAGAIPLLIDALRDEWERVSNSERECELLRRELDEAYELGGKDED